MLGSHGGVRPGYGRETDGTCMGHGEVLARVGTRTLGRELHTDGMRMRSYRALGWDTYGRGESSEGQVPFPPPPPPPPPLSLPSLPSFPPLPVSRFVFVSAFRPPWSQAFQFLRLAQLASLLLGGLGAPLLIATLAAGVF